jgi:hypothetical protein
MVLVLLEPPAVLLAEGRRRRCWPWMRRCGCGAEQGYEPCPWRVSAAERELPGAEVSAELYARAAEAALSDAEPLQYNAYKVPLTKALIRQALTTPRLDGVAGI